MYFKDFAKNVFFNFFFINVRGKETQGNFSENENNKNYSFLIFGKYNGMSTYRLFYA